MITEYAEGINGLMDKEAADLVLFRLRGNHYSEALETFGLRERAYMNIVTNAANALKSAGVYVEVVGNYEPEIVGKLQWYEKIWHTEMNPYEHLVSMLMEIDEGYLAEAYDAVQSRRRKILPQGIFKNPDNAAALVRHVLEENIQGLKEADRKEAVRLLKEHITSAELGYKNCLYGLGLGGMMTNAHGINNSPLRVLEIYDVSRTRQDGLSLFDLDQESHLHPWDVTPISYWQDSDNVMLAVKHMLEENIPGLKKADRKEALRLLKEHVIGAEGGSSYYLHRLGLGGIMTRVPGINNSPIRMIEVYDAAKTLGSPSLEPSLFDYNERSYLGIIINDFGMQELSVCAGKN
jgi:hypothetical protein